MGDNPPDRPRRAPGDGTHGRLGLDVPGEEREDDKEARPDAAAASARTRERPKKYSSATPADALTSATLARLGV
jgi:hypothetical protein